MNNYEMTSLINNFKKRNSDSFEEIYIIFEKLIHFYAKKVDNFDPLDIEQELIVFMITLVKTMNLDKFQKDNTDTIKRYIAVAIKNKYMAITKKYQKLQSTFVEYNENVETCEFFCDDRFIIEQCMSLLSKSQQNLIYYKYFMGYSDTEIAFFLKISRQAVN